MNPYSVCIDFSLSLQARLESVEQLSLTEKEGLLEHVCSAQMISPLFIYSQYLQYLILRPEFPLLRRIRIAELCDLGWTALYLLTRITIEYERVRCIEWFSNPYLKIHAYNVLFPRANIETQIQILKNMYTLPRVNIQAIDEWWIKHLSDETLEYKIRSNCADALLNHSREKKYLEQAQTFLGINNISQSVYQHRENVHLFLPNIQLLEQIISSETSVSVDTIIAFITQMGLSVNLFQSRILNDKTRFGREITLEILITKVWSVLTDDLRKILITDLYSSEELEESWMCTTGYYNRIINIYQIMITDQILFDSQHEFNSYLNQQINHYLSCSDDREDILLELPQSGEERRMRYLNFKVQTLPRIIDELKQSFSHLSEAQFDQCFSIALRRYEDTL